MWHARGRLTHLHSLVEELHDVGLLHELADVSIQPLSKPRQEVKRNYHEVLVSCLKLTGVLSMCLKLGKQDMVTGLKRHGGDPTDKK